MSRRVTHREDHAATSHSHDRMSFANPLTIELGKRLRLFARTRLTEEPPEMIGKGFGGCLVVQILVFAVRREDSELEYILTEAEILDFGTERDQTRLLEVHRVQAAAFVVRMEIHQSESAPGCEIPARGFLRWLAGGAREHERSRCQHEYSFHGAFLDVDYRLNARAAKPAKNGSAAHVT